MKTCLDCGETLSLAEFPVKDRGRRGPRCKPCHAQYLKPLRKAWYEKNKERKKRKSAEWREKNRDLIPQKRQEYRAKALDKIRAKDARYARENRHVKQANAAAYRARKTQQTIQLTLVQRDAIREIYRRAQFLSRTTGESHHVDHILPLRHKDVCGLHVPWNLQIIPGRLNTRKRNNAPLDTLTLTQILPRDANEAEHPGT